RPAGVLDRVGPRARGGDRQYRQSVAAARHAAVDRRAGDAADRALFRWYAADSGARGAARWIARGRRVLRGARARRARADAESAVAARRGGGLVHARPRGAPLAPSAAGLSGLVLVQVRG